MGQTSALVIGVAWISAILGLILAPFTFVHTGRKTRTGALVGALGGGVLIFIWRRVARARRRPTTESSPLSVEMPVVEQRQQQPLAPAHTASRVKAREPVSPAGGHETDWDTQLFLLSRAIKADPNAPVNYLLRGEEWLARGQVEQAQVDFLRARARAEDMLRESAWGYIYQSYIDRVDAGLRYCEQVS
jgi:hypothetical protein